MNVLIECCALMLSFLGPVVRTVLLSTREAPWDALGRFLW